MRPLFFHALIVALLSGAKLTSAELTPARQQFRQEIATHYRAADGLPALDVQLLDISDGSPPRALCGGRWLEFRNNRWNEISGHDSRSRDQFVVPDVSGSPVTVSIPWREVHQILRAKEQVWIATAADPFVISNGRAETLGWPSRYRVNQIAVPPGGGPLHVASSAGVFIRGQNGWTPMGIPDGLGRAWAVQDVLGIAFDSRGQLWFATKAGVGCRAESGWRFFEGKDGLPWNDFTGMTAGSDGAMWFGTKLGAIRFDGTDWHYRQGQRWLPHDEVRQIGVDPSGAAWFATGGGVGRIEFKPMTLHEKAAHYESEIARFIKRTPLGYVAEAHLRRPGDKSTAETHDSDNDGLWTSMYGAGECFAYGATRDHQARERARLAFEALRFLQKVTQGGSHSPPKGYIARTIRSTDSPDPNVGRIERDREEQKQDKLWKVYEPRWPRSADGKWFWKSDTSSDELDGHYFFYPLYYELCAESENEKERVREVVRDITDHLLQHEFVLVDHDGRPTRWAIFGPKYLNHDSNWWQERGLNSLSMLSYLAVASFVTGDPKYEAASRDLIDKHGYALNAMYPKAQNGPGSGNQSDDEMAFMSYYSLLRYSRDEALKNQIRFSFFRYWANEAPEMNPFFNFAYAGLSLNASVPTVWRTISVAPWPGWWEDSIAVLYGFPLDRLNWPHRNSHRLDLRMLSRERASDPSEAERGGRGHRMNGKVLPIENRHFNHWNTDPWRFDYGGEGNELASGAVFLLPYYMGLYHGFIEKP